MSNYTDKDPITNGNGINNGSQSGRPQNPGETQLPPYLRDAMGNGYNGNSSASGTGSGYGNGTGYGSSSGYGSGTGYGYGGSGNGGSGYGSGTGYGYGGSGNGGSGYGSGDGYNGNTPGTSSEKRPPKRNPSFGIGLLVGLIVGICLCAIVCIVAVVAMYNTDSMKLNYSSSEKLSVLRGMIREYYLDEKNVADDQLDDGMYRGMLDSLRDPYSVYYTQEEYTAMKESTAGTFGGVGIQMTQGNEDRLIKVYKVVAGTPAEKAGVMDDDILIKVDGEDIEGMDLSTVVSKVRGEVGTSVHLTFLRDGKEVDFDVIRDTIESETVTGRMQDDEQKIGYIYISEFDTVTYSQFMSKLKELKEQGMKSLILDMRENPGGNVDTVCDIADELMPEGKIFFVRDKNGKSKEYSSDASRSFVGDMVVLVDNNSASAAEILTGALKDHKLATVVGVKTFGKGIVQSLYPLGDGTAVKLTVEDYFTAGGHNIHKVGIAPDVEVELDRDAYKESGYDNQLEKAVELLGGTYVNDRSVSGNDAEAAPGDGER